MAKTALAKTVARCSAAMSGITRSGFAPRHTTTHVPGTSDYDGPPIHPPLVARYYVYGMEALPDGPVNETQVVLP